MVNDYFSIHSYRLSLIEKEIGRLALPKSAKLLDIGAYPPHLFHSLSSKYPTWGISSSHEPIPHPRIVTLNIDHEPFPFPAGFFNLVIFAEVIEHMFRGVDHIFSEINRITAPGGFLILTTPNALRSHNLVKILFGQNPSFPLADLALDDLKTGSIYHRHHREYAIQELATLAKNHHLTPIVSRHIIAYPPFRLKSFREPLWLQLAKWANYFFMLLFRNRRDSLLLVSQK